MKSDMVTLVQQLSDSEIRRLNAEAAVTDHHYQVNEVQPPVPQSLTSTVAPQQPKPIDQQQQQQQQQLNNRIKD